MMFGLILLIFIAYYMLDTSNSRGSLDPKYQSRKRDLESYDITKGKQL